MKCAIAIALSLLVLAMLASCGDNSPPPPPEPDIEATVETRVAKALAEATPASTRVPIGTPTASPVPSPTSTTIPSPILEQTSNTNPQTGLGVPFIEIKEAFALAEYTPIICTFPENYDKPECQRKDNLALYRAPNKHVEVLFRGLMNDLHTVAVAFNVDAAIQDMRILNEFSGASILVAEHVVPLWDREDRINFLSSTIQTLSTDPTSEITEHVGHVNIKSSVNTQNWMIVLFERSIETEANHTRKEPSLRVNWHEIKNDYALEGFTSQICLNFTEYTFPLCHIDTTAVQIHQSKGYITYSGRLSDLRGVGVFTDSNASIEDIQKIQKIAIHHIIPEWTQSDTWIHQSISTIKQNPESVLKTQVGDKEIKMSGIKLKPIIVLEIKFLK